MEIRNTQIQEKRIEMAQEAKQVLELLNKIEDFTINLKKKLLAEIKEAKPSIHLQLQDIES